MLIHQQKFHNGITLEAQYHKIDQSYQDIQRGLMNNENNLHLWLSTCRKPFRCKLCKRRTKTQKAMERHQQLYHNQNSQLIVKQCEICHKRMFSDRMEQHMLLHTSKEFKCNYCGVVYKHKSYLNLHVSKYHSGGKFP